ncbi:MAG: hypothetical protein ACYC3X_02775 [Pirellulaceae bacterium]
MLVGMDGDVPQPGPAFRAPEGEAEERTWTDWPRCAHCGRPRLTVCPSCGVAGTQFPLAEYLSPAAPLHSSRGRGTEAPRQDEDTLEILLVCPQCDEAFRPRFYRHCPECGHDAQEGLQVQSRSAPPLSDATLLALAGLLVTALALVLYFRWLFPP